MKNRLKITMICLMAFFALSCEPENETIEEHPISAEIQEIPVTQDYLVGALYLANKWGYNQEEVPLAGEYEIGNAEAMKQHVEWGAAGGVDFFMFSFREAGNSQDISMIEAFQANNAEGTMKFSLRLNVGPFDLEADNTLEDQGRVEDLITIFKGMIPFFEDPNYQKIDDKYFVSIIGAHNFHCNDLQEVYRQIREAMSAEGYELYLLGEQGNGWVPPARFEMFYENALDAVSFTTMFNDNYYDRYSSFPQYLDLHWDYSKEYYMNSVGGVEWVPTVAPSFNPLIAKPESTSYRHVRDEQRFKDVLNVAKKNIGASRLMIVNSFNDWEDDTQLEPAESYGTSTLDILRQQTKVN
ncbi:glycoside hydrolase family 99-like domain-containing protein [Flammeovirga sp. OC4]|uniref:glycoside hydrolase family 99-like domain-containing protein n=1 Tax=Flammeovirga sp. OC4 TaxID=1382345 RepID=UPI00155D9B7B|nr:glycoside hydrolase family 99-like domain-containing protein [Flammeovirga sp. OC4]